MDPPRRPLVTELALPAPLQDGCPVCQDLRRPEDSWKTKIPFRDMCKASDNGCPGCRFLRHLLQVRSRTHRFEDVLTRTSWVGLSFGLGRGANDDRGDMLDLIVLRDKKDQWFDRFEVYTRLGVSLPSTVNIKVAKLP